MCNHKKKAQKQQQNQKGSLFDETSRREFYEYHKECNGSYILLSDYQMAQRNNLVLANKNNPRKQSFNRFPTQSALSEIVTLLAGYTVLGSKRSQKELAKLLLSCDEKTYMNFVGLHSYVLSQTQYIYDYRLLKPGPNNIGLKKSPEMLKNYLPNVISMLKRTAKLKNKNSIRANLTLAFLYLGNLERDNFNPNSRNVEYRLSGILDFSLDVLFETIANINKNNSNKDENIQIAMQFATEHCQVAIQYIISEILRGNVKENLENWQRKSENAPVVRTQIAQEYLLEGMMGLHKYELNLHNFGGITECLFDGGVPSSNDLEELIKTPVMKLLEEWDPVFLFHSSRGWANTFVSESIRNAYLQRGIPFKEEELATLTRSDVINSNHYPNSGIFILDLLACGQRKNIPEGCVRETEAELGAELYDIAVELGSKLYKTADELRCFKLYVTAAALGSEPACYYLSGLAVEAAELKKADYFLHLAAKHSNLKNRYRLLTYSAYNCSDDGLIISMIDLAYSMLNKSKITLEEFFPFYLRWHGLLMLRGCVSSMKIIESLYASYLDSLANLSDVYHASKQFIELSYLILNFQNYIYLPKLEKITDAISNFHINNQTASVEKVARFKKKTPSNFRLFSCQHRDRMTSLEDPLSHRFDYKFKWNR